MNHPLIRTFHIGAWLLAQTGSPHLIGRDLGRRCREAIEAQLSTTAGEAVTTLDCATLDHLDFTAADEGIVKLIGHLQAQDYGDLYVVLSGCTPTQEENLRVALDRKHLALVVQRKSGPDVIGDLTPYLRAILPFLHSQPALTARALADASGEEINLGSTKLLSLHRCRMVTRLSERLPDGGRQFVYRLVQGTYVERPGTMRAQGQRTKGGERC